MKNFIITMIKKYKSVLLYLIFGVLTTLISISTFILFNMKFNEHISNILSWIISVLFAFIVNKLFVFFNTEYKLSDIIRQMLLFFGGRIFTLMTEEVIIFVFITKLSYNSAIVKTAAQIVVIILNYFLSKKALLKKSEKKNS